MNLLESLKINLFSDKRILPQSEAKFQFSIQNSLKESKSLKKYMQNTYFTPVIMKH